MRLSIGATGLQVAGQKIGLRFIACGFFRKEGLGVLLSIIQIHSSGNCRETSWLLA